MENLQTTYEFDVWTDDFIIPKTMNMKNKPSTSPSFLIEFRVQEFLRYLPKEGDSIVEEPRGPFTVTSFCLPRNAVMISDDDADDSICEILSSVGVPLTMLSIIRGVSSFARTMMSLPANFDRPLLPIVLGIEVTTWDPRDAATAYERKFRQRIKDERSYRVCLTPILDIRYRVEA